MSASIDPTRSAADAASVSQTGAYRPCTGIVARRLGDRMVVVNTTSNGIYELNETGALIWEGLEAGKGLDEIMSTLEKQFVVTEGDARTETIALLSSLCSAGLLLRC